VTPILSGEEQAKLKRPRVPARIADSPLRVGPIGEINTDGFTKLTPDEIGGEACAEQTVIQRPSLPEVDCTAKASKMTLKTLPNQRCFVRFGKDCVEGGIDVALRDASGAQFVRDTETSLPASIGVVSGVFDRVAGVVEVVLFAKPRNDGAHVPFCLGAAPEILTHLLDGMRAARQRPKRRGVKLLLG